MREEPKRDGVGPAAVLITERGDVIAKSAGGVPVRTAHRDEQLSSVGGFGCPAKASRASVVEELRPRQRLGVQRPADEAHDAQYAQCGRSAPRCTPERTESEGDGERKIHTRVEGRWLTLTRTA